MTLVFVKAIIKIVIGISVSIILSSNSYSQQWCNNITLLSRVDANNSCNPNGREGRRCDNSFPAASKQWQACYSAIRKCYKQIDADNLKINENNALFYKCKSAFRTKKPKSAESKKWTDKLRQAENRSKGADKENVKNREALDSDVQRTVKETAALQKAREKQFLKEQEENRKAQVRQRAALEADIMRQKRNQAKIRRQLEASQRSDPPVIGSPRTNCAEWRHTWNVHQEQHGGSAHLHEDSEGRDIIQMYEAYCR